MRAGRKKGTPKTGGIQKGSHHKRTNAYLQKLAQSGLTPLEYFLGTLRDRRSSEADRRWAAEHAAPFMHARLASSEAKITGHLTLEQLVAATLDAAGKSNESEAE